MVKIKKQSKNYSRNISKQTLENFFRLFIIRFHQQLKSYGFHLDILGFYFLRTNNYILTNHYENNLIFLDRYIYDLWAKDLVAKHKLSSKLVINIVYYFFCKVIYKPRMAFILNDDSRNIYKRKNELSINQLDNFNNILLKKLSKFKVPHKVINVTNNSL